MSSDLALAASLALAVGAALGFVHFATLGLVAERFAQGRLFGAVGIQIARLLLVGAVLVGAVRFGALPLIACLAGLLLGRWIFLRRARAAS